MKLLLRANVFGWIITRFLGKNANWFFGFSKKPLFKVENVNENRK